MRSSTSPVRTLVGWYLVTRDLATIAAFLAFLAFLAFACPAAGCSAAARSAPASLRAHRLTMAAAADTVTRVYVPAGARATTLDVRLSANELASIAVRIQGVDGVRCATVGATGAACRLRLADGAGGVCPVPAQNAVLRCWLPASWGFDGAGGFVVEVVGGARRGRMAAPEALSAAPPAVHWSPARSWGRGRHPATRPPPPA